MYVPTNHIYLGEVIFIPEEKAVRLEMSIEQAVRLLVSGGIAAPRELRRVQGGFKAGLDKGIGGPVL